MSTVVMNDGAVAFRDLSPRSVSVTFDFVSRTFDLFSYVNRLERESGYPGARMVVAAGFRVRRESNVKEYLMNGIGRFLISKAKSGEITVEQAITTALMVRPYYDFLPELQANFAFTKAYLADHSGSKAGLGGPNYYIDTSLFSTPCPSWLRLGNFIDWSERGLSCTFGHLKGLRKSIARNSNFKGALDAFEVAERIANSDKVVEILQNLRMRDRVPRRLKGNQAEKANSGEST